MLKMPIPDCAALHPGYDLIRKFQTATSFVIPGRALRANPESRDWTAELTTSGFRVRLRKGASTPE
jgi:hypothetical protein